VTPPQPVQLPLELHPTGQGRVLTWDRKKSRLKLIQSGFSPEHYTVHPFRQAKSPTAYAFVLQHHYSGSAPSAKLAYGLWRRHDDKLVGVALLSMGMNPRTVTNVFPELAGLTQGDLATKALELGRFVLLDEVPGRAETWFLARCFDHARAQGLRGVISFSDPVPRRNDAGELVFPGHVGAIYQASNALYTGRGTARTLQLIDGRPLVERGRSKARAGESGGDAQVRRLVALGADAPCLGEDMGAWTTRALAKLATPLRHPGNHRYIFALKPKTLLVAVPALPYPKRVDSEKEAA
jgi:hypothetical protein